jgi:carbon monoxide dehydrogenase subunit G
MARSQVTTELPVPPGVAWARASDFSRYDQWFTMHGGWRSELPPKIVEGSTAVSDVLVKGIRQKVQWTAVRCEEPSRLTLHGKGVMGVHVVVDLAIAEAGGGTTVSLDLDITGAAVAGPIGLAVSRALKGEIRQSLDRFAGMAD